MRHRICRITFCVLLVAGVALAQDRNNASTWYRRAFEAYENITEADREIIVDYTRNPEGAPSPGVRRVLRKASEIFRHMRRGSEQEYSDWDLDYQQGFELILPHLSQFRGIARLMQADALARLHEGDTLGAADRLASLYRISRHTGSDRILISSLVGNAIFRGADSTVQIALDRADIGPAESAKLLRAINGFDESDPFDHLEAVMGEQEIAVDWLQRKFGDETERLRMAESEEWLTNDEADALRLGAMTNEEFALSLDQYGRAMDRVVEAFAMEDEDAARAALKQLEEETIRGELGFLAQILMPTLSRVLENKIESKKMIDARAEMLSKLLSGEIEPKAEANAALFYLRGIELFQEMDPERYSLLREFDDDPDRPISETLMETLNGSSKIIDLFREGSLKRRCDFSRFRSSRDLLLIPDYAPGLRDVFRLLHADALRLIRKGDMPEACDRLTISFRVIGHLSGDEMLIMPLISHGTFLRSHSQAKMVITHGSSGEIERRTLLDAIEHISRKDPFGYIGAVLHLRKQLASVLWRRDPQSGINRKEAIEKLVATFNGDQLFYYLAIFDTLTKASEKSAESGKDDSIAKLNDILSERDLEAVRSDVPRVAPILAEHQFDIFTNRQIPLFADYARRMRFARSDLRKGFSLLAPPAKEKSVK